MDSSSQEGKGKMKITEVKTFPVPFTLGEKKENITITTNTPSKASKEQIINQALKFHSQGNIPEAAKYYQYFINQGFNDHKVFSNYGVLLKELGNLQEAELSQRKAIKIKPDYAIAHYNLGLILKDLGKSQEAELSYRKAIELNPYYEIAHSNLGNTLKDLGKLEEAELSYRKAIEINPYYEIAHSNLGNILSDLGKLQEAELSYRKAIEINPNFAESHSNLGITLQELGNLQEAELSTRKAIEIKPGYAEAHSNLGTILTDLGKSQDAELSYRKAIEIKPDYADAYFNLFRHYEQINNLEKLEESLNEFNKIDSIKNELLLFRARLSYRNKEYQNAKELIDNISPEWIEKSNNSKNTVFCSYKAFIEDKVGNYDIAYSCFEQSQKDPLYERFSKDIYLNFIQTYKNSIINKEIKFNTINDEIQDSNLCFLIGFPRSGTTLLDTILRSHKDVEVIEEQPLISTIEKLIKEKFHTEIDNLYSLSMDKIIILRKKYFELLGKCRNKEASLIIDKLPLLTVSLPLINLLFPNAKIVFTHRHPYDTVLSCFQQSFKPNIAMANLVSLKSSSILYDQVMNVWDIYMNNLTINCITSKYEHLIEDFDNHIFKILDFLDVGWDENVKNYRKTALERGMINTPSSSQVVQPLYKSSIDKWKNYEEYFEDCHQYLERWMSYFDY